MTISALILMISTMSFVVVAMVYFFVRVLTAPERPEAGLLDGQDQDEMKESAAVEH